MEKVQLIKKKLLYKESGNVHGKVGVYLL